MIDKIIREAIYPAPRNSDATPKDYGIAFQDIAFVSQDGCQLNGWWLPRTRARATIIFLYGNGENISAWASLGEQLSFLNVNIFLFDYRGYGRSSGTPSEVGLRRDACAAFDTVQNELHNRQAIPIVAFGRSLGGAVAIQLAVDRPVSGLVIESSFTCLADLAKSLFPGGKFLGPVIRAVLRKERYRSVDKVNALTIPKLFAHSPDDDIIPFTNGERLFAAAAAPKVFCTLDGDHNIEKLGQKRYQKALGDLLDTVASGEKIM